MLITTSSFYSPNCACLATDHINCPTQLPGTKQMHLFRLKDMRRSSVPHYYTDFSRTFFSTREKSLEAALKLDKRWTRSPFSLLSNLSSACRGELGLSEHLETRSEESPHTGVITRVAHSGSELKSFTHSPDLNNHFQIRLRESGEYLSGEAFTVISPDFCCFLSNLPSVADTTEVIYKSDSQTLSSPPPWGLLCF